MLTLAIPTFNSARYLPYTLESLAAQGDSVRWYLQDGASKDGTADIARKFARPCDVVVSEPDRGQTDALNKAFPKMGGDIIGFINGDDLLTPGAADVIVDTFAKNPDIDIIYGEVEWIDSDNNVTGHHKGDISSLEEMLDLYTVWFGQRQWVQPEVFYRRSLWDKAGPLNTTYDLAFDFAFWVSCLQAGARVLRVPRPFAQFRLHQDQKSTNATKAAAELRAIVRAALALDPPINPAVRARITAQLDYDDYQLSTDPKAPFAQALIRNPGWIRSPAVRERLITSLRRKS